MKRKSITVYSVIITFVFVFAVAFFGYNIFSELKTGNIRSKKIFDTLTSNIKELDNSEKINTIIQNSEYYSALYISDNQTTLISYPNDNAKNAESTNLVKVYKKEIVNDKNTYNITAAIYMLRPATIFYYARFSFIIIMVATIFTTILIIYFSLTTKNDVKIDSDSNDEDSNDTLDGDIDTNDIFNNEQPLDSVDDYAKEEVKETVDEPKPEDTTEEQNVYENEILEDEKPVQEDNYQESLDINESKDEDNEAKDIFSPVTGFCWESQLKNRLETELIRASSSEQDISLFLIKVPGLSFTDNVTKDIADFLLKEIQFRDKIFEYKNDSFAVIKAETSIDEAEDYAEVLQKTISEIVHSDEKDCFIGISSRSIRMLSAERLIMEADEALKHAEDDKSSKIIGFHVDIEKYRQFINNN